ncbi:calcium-binding protein [Streptomyces bluensis]|uniref:calcium-binding protein n=1 Tax=Streptomyces bluensis TaxID=33897 RepID=UPI00331A89BB
MRMRATVAAVSGALALSALAVPAAQADAEPGALASSVTPFGADAFGATAAADEVVGDTVIDKVTVNGGKDVVVGTTNKKTFTISVTATDPSGIEDGYAFLWHGTDIDTDVDGAIVPDAETGTCTALNARSATCKVTVVADPNENIYSNVLAGKWKVFAGALGKDGDYVLKDAYKTHSVKRYSRLTVNASPEPVKKGKTITVTGALTRANWDTGKYAGYTNQSVKLQFKKKGSTTYTDVKTIKSGSAGALKTTVTATTDGTFRYVFAGTSTTPAVTSSGDFVDVQ